MRVAVIGTSGSGKTTFAGRLAASTGYAGMQIWLERAIGALFVAVGIKLAIAEAN